VIFQIEVALDDSKINPQASTSSRSFVQSLFCGTTRQVLDFEDSANLTTRVKEEPFSYLLVDVAQEGKDLYEGLDDAFASSFVEIEGKKARRQDVLTELPPILQIQLQVGDISPEDSLVSSLTLCNPG
jgi:ubiquitin carboxyl-terminal hydrolase 25/28